MDEHQPTLDNVYSMIGLGLTHIQDVEKIIKFTTTFVIQENSPLTLDKLNKLSAKERKNTLGQYFGKIKDRVDLHPLLDELMTRYLQDRNNFIHNQESIPGWDINTEDGIKKVNLFIFNMIKDGNSIIEIFVVLMNKWATQIGILINIPKEDEAYISNIKKQYEAHLDDLFISKT